MLIGVIGLVLLLAAWLVELIISLKKHKVLIDLRFAAMYLAATVALTTYAYQINDPIFFWLQMGLIALVVFEVAYTLKLKR